MARYIYGSLGVYNNEKIHLYSRLVGAGTQFSVIILRNIAAAFFKDDALCKIRLKSGF